MTEPSGIAERLEAFRRRHGVAAVGAATLAMDAIAGSGASAGVAPEQRTAVVGVVARGVDDQVVTTDAWHIGSCTKPLTAALYATLVEQGRAEWGARIVDLLPDAAPQTDHGWSEVTVDELFTCRSGLPANPDRATIERGFDDPTDIVDQRSRAAHAAFEGRPAGRGRFRYSNLGYVLAGAVIDRISGTSYEAALRTELLDPLGVTTAGFGAPPRVSGHWPRVQVGALCLGRGAAAPPDDRRSDNPPLFASAGCLHLSIPDWARVQRLFLDGAGVLSSASIRRLLEVPRDGRGMAMGWAAPKGLPGVAFATQGSNTAWAAAAVMNAQRDRMALVVANDGRTTMLRSTALLAAELLREDRD